MKVALIYDRVNKFGGAERLLLSIHKIFPDAPLFTLVYDKKSSKWAQNFKIIPTFLNKLPWLRKRHELLAPIAPLAFETLDLSDYDVIISITSSDAKSIITSPKQLHICYCLTPTRYFWSGNKEYSRDIKLKILPNFIYNYLRTIDLLTSTRADEYIAISEEVKKRIKKYYNRDSSVIYPPIDDKFYSENNTPIRNRDYYLVVSRLVPYKKTELAISVFNKLNKKLIVVGDGSEMNRLKKISNRNIIFTGKVSDSELINIYKDAKAVIFPQDEDFGLVPIEAQACGTPVIALGRGGALETIISGKTGIFFKNQTIKSLESAINKFESLAINPHNCISNARKFSQAIFETEMKKQINQLISKHESSLSFRA